MKFFKRFFVALICLTLLTGWGVRKDSPEQKRDEIDQATQQVLADLNREVPATPCV